MGLLTFFRTTNLVPQIAYFCRIAIILDQPNNISKIFTNKSSDDVLIKSMRKITRKYIDITKIIRNLEKRKRYAHVLFERLGDWIEISRIAEGYMYVRGLIVHNEVDLCTILQFCLEDVRVVQYLESYFMLPITGEFESMINNYREVHFTSNYSSYVNLLSPVNEFENSCHKLMKSSIRWGYPELTWQMLNQSPTPNNIIGCYLQNIVYRYLIMPGRSKFLDNDEIEDRINFWNTYKTKECKPSSRSTFYDNLVRYADLNLVLRIWNLEFFSINTKLFIRIIRLEDDSTISDQVILNLMSGNGRWWTGGIDLLRVYRVAVCHRSRFIPFLIENCKTYSGYNRIIVDHALRNDDWDTLTSHCRGITIDFLFIKAALYGSLQIINQLCLRCLEQKRSPPYDRAIKRLRRSRNPNSTPMIEHIRHMKTN